MTNNELKIKVSGGRVIEAKVLPDGCCLLTVELTTVTTEDTCHQPEDIFRKVPASELRLDDEFLKHQPKTNREQNFKDKVETAIKRGLKDFWRPVCDPSINDAGHICYEPGNKPAVGESYNWWYKTAKDFCPERGSRLGTKSEYIAFLAVLIKELVASGESIEWAWNAVCNDSENLGYQNAKYDFEPTGSREICGWCDLANVYKILSEDEETGGFLIAGGNFNYWNYYLPLAVLYRSCNRGDKYFYSCGWLVFDSCPDC